MLDPTPLVDAVVTAWQSIPALVTALGGNPDNIYAHHWYYGTQFRLEEAIDKMTAPSILVAWMGMRFGNFNGAEEFRDQVDAYVRTPNEAGQSQPVAFENVWRLLFNSPVNGTGQDIRHVEIVPGQWTLIDGLSTNPIQDSERMDFFKVSMVFPQLGDQ